MNDEEYVEELHLLMDALRQRIKELETELRQVYDNLTATQTRCSELLLENRKLRRVDTDRKIPET